jgi:hypothetical protein
LVQLQQERDNETFTFAKGRPSEKKGMKKIRLTNGNQHDPKPGASPVTNADAMEKGTVWVERRNSRLSPLVNQNENSISLV